MSNKQIYDTVFRSYFNDKRRFLSLGNAVLGKSLTNPDDIEFNTLDGAFYSNLKNDISCLFGDNLLCVLEHQSTVNANIVFRMLCYVAELYQQHVARVGLNMYRPSLNKLPTPRFVVFYEGEESKPPIETLRLSDAFDGDASSLELNATVYNIHGDLNENLKAKCDYLRQYSEFSNYHRMLRKKGLSGNDAIRETIDYCRRRQIMIDYLDEHGSEVFRMINMEWDADKAYNAYLQEGIERGFERGIERGRAEGLLQALKNLISSQNISADKAMNALGIPADEQPRYVALLR